MLVPLDTGANVNMITLECMAALQFQVGPLRFAQRGHNCGPALQL